MINPQRGEIWLVDLNPTRGQEIQKTRPVVIISAKIFNPIALRIVIPITSWQEKFTNRPFMVPILAISEHGLEHNSAGNVLQVRSISIERFIRYLGEITDETLQELLAGLIICIDVIQNYKKYLFHRISK